MAATIFHGAPGSYKSSSAFWFEIIPALRQGRLVVTNIEGLLTKESIEIELNETFPESAQLWRLSSQSDKGKYLWQRWFWWMPVKAFIVMDEIQDIFPNDSTVFKPKDFDSLGIETLKDKLPEHFYDYFIKVKSEYTPPQDEGSTDDTGDLILDENGEIIYPPNMREANMRHRKFGWDIIYCTPDITEIHKLVRAVCEFGYAHKYNKSLEFIPYYKARTRIHEHNPKSNGYPRKKDDPTKWRKIPDQVFKCYRSTSTGEFSGRKGVNAFTSPLFIICISLFFLPLFYVAWWLFFQEEDKADIAKSPQPVKASTGVRVENITKSDASIVNNDNSKAHISKPFSLDLPYQADHIYLNGYVDVILNKQKRYKTYLFSAHKGQDIYHLTETDIEYFGFQIRFVNPCHVDIKQQDQVYTIRCKPKSFQPHIENLASNPIQETFTNL